MPQKNRDYQLTEDLLVRYREEALANSQALLDEASLLLSHGHFARAYFLAASSIEEAGKAVQAFQGLGRNLRDPAVAHRLKMQFEDHSNKLTAAFSPWIQATPNIRAEVSDFTRIMVDLKFGREAAIYTDINAEQSIVTTPKIQVKEKAARHCVHLAGSVLAHVGPYVLSQPKQSTRVQDEFFALKPSVFQRMSKTADFWEFYVARVEAGDVALEGAVVDYNKQYFSQARLFMPTDGQAG